MAQGYGDVMTLGTLRGLGPLMASMVGLALLGVGIGYAVGHLRDDGPVLIESAAPVPAESPSYPVDPPLVIEPDPDVAPLARDLKTHVERVGEEPFGMRLPVPDGWVRSNSKAGQWQWYVAGHPDFTYVMRVVLVSGFATIPSAIQSRIEALDEADETAEFDLETTTTDGFVATYVLGDHRRLTMERFLSLDDTDTLYATVAVIGRESDRAGLSDLIERVSAGATR